MPKNQLTDQELAAIHETFTHHPPKDDQPDRYMTIRADAKKLATTIMECCPSSRHRSVALTRLEEVCMWANKSIAME